jgi:sugar transferase (PEP-CTERM/EpsH1 system associated)
VTYVEQKQKFTQRIRIVYLVHTLRFAGLENVVVNLANNLDPSLFECTIVSLAPHDPLHNKVHAEQVHIVSFNKRDGNDPRLIYRLYRFLRNEKPHIVQTHNWGTLLEGALAAKLAGVPIVIHAERGTIDGRRLHLFVHRWLLKIVHQVLSVSEAHRQRLADSTGFPYQKIKPIPNGVDISLFSPRPTEKQRIRKNLGLELTPIYIGTVANLRPVKNHALLLRVGSRLCRSHDHVRFVFAGDGPLKEQLVALAEELGISARVRFLGARSDIPDVLNALDIFVLPSLSEGMPNAVLEAMACGLPIVATRVGGIPELIEDGNTGLLVPSEGERQLETILGNLLCCDAKRRALGEKGRQRVLQCFRLERMVNEYQELYYSLVIKKVAGYA